MARGRMIDKVVILSKKINAVSEGTENMYYRININADDFGRYYAEPEILKGQIYTIRKISLKEIRRRLDELWKIGLIKIYPINDERYLEIIDFEKHQIFKSDRPKKGEHPEPKGYLKYEPESKMEPLGNQMDTNGSLRKEGTISNFNSKKAEIKAFDSLFEDFWKNYPREGKVEKKTAYKKFMAIANAGKLDELKEGFRCYMDYLRHRELNEGFKQRAKDAKTFLNHYDEFKGFKYEPRL